MRCTHTLVMNLLLIFISARLVHTMQLNGEFERLIVFLSQNNSYQAVLITDGAEKSFAIFTFKCGSLGWSGRRSTIGFNARGEIWANHPLSGQPYSNAIACLNSHSVWNNIVYDLTSYTNNTDHGSGSQSSETIPKL